LLKPISYARNLKHNGVSFTKVLSVLEARIRHVEGVERTESL